MQKIVQAKKLNKKMAVEFFVYLTGHAKTKINSEIVEKHNCFKIVLGQIRYDLFKSDGSLFLYHTIYGKMTETTFDFVTWGPDSMYEIATNKMQENEYKQEMIEAYKKKHNCFCDRT